jgi:hypothetical protein
MTIDMQRRDFLKLLGAEGRLLHHSTIINISGESYRLKDKRRAGLLPKPN